MSNSLRPVTQRFPLSHQVWQDTNLPLSCVVQPLAVEENDTSAATELPLLTDIAKCLECGAPHPDSVSHFRPHGNQTHLLCFLCGQTTLATRQEQQAQRPYEALEATSDGAPVLKALRSPTRKRSKSSSHVVQLPLRGVPSTPSLRYSIPATHCPLLWWIVLDGACTSRLYWRTMSEQLSTLVAQAPSHVRVSILLVPCSGIDATDNDDTATTVGLFRLDSPVPHVQHFRSWEALEPQLVASLVSCTLAHVATALRSLLDYAPPHYIQSISHSSMSVVLSQTASCITQALWEARAHPCGQRHAEETSLAYAGGRIWCCWAPPATTRGTPATTVAGGRVASSLSDGQPLPTWTDEGLSQAYDATSTTDRIPELAAVGRQCAAAALGVDVTLVLDDHEEACWPPLELPLWSRLVCEASGAPEPLLVRLSEPRLATEWWSRRPWRSGTVYGVELRLRLSEGWSVEDTSPSDDDKAPTDLASYVQSHGWTGPGCGVAGQNLWRLGMADPWTTLSVDLALTEAALMRQQHVEGIGQIPLPSVLQTCVVYTTIIPDDTLADSYRTVRRMKIASVAVPLVENVEALYDSLDTEALAVILFHKLVLSSFQDGFEETAEIGQKWLESVLTCAYRSAEEQERIEQEQADRMEENKRSHFYPQERLLHLDGDLSEKEVLLGMGHSRLRPMALMIYLLLQLDAIRVQSGCSSLDLRAVALAQMMMMDSSVLARCLAPRIQLWASGNDETEPILDVIGLSADAVQLAVLEYSGISPLILFLDSPSQILVMDARYITSDAVPNSTKRLTVGDSLQATIEETVSSYRTAPPVVYALDSAAFADDMILQSLQDTLMEDAPSPFGHESFSQWKADVAKEVAHGLDLEIK